jgi:hypothetical protein
VNEAEDITTTTTETLLEGIIESGPTCRYGEPPKGERHDFGYSPELLMLFCRSCGRVETIA